MTALLKAADLSRGQFLDLVSQLRLAEASISTRRIWLEAPDGWAFDWWQGLEDSLRWCGAGREPEQELASSCISRSTAGRLFTPEGELRWRIIAALGTSCCRTVFLGNVDWVPEGLDDQSYHLQDLQPYPRRFFLWGQQTESTPQEWVELRIPHRFQYPVSPQARHVQLVAEQWQDDSGEPHFLRLRDLRPFPEKT